MIGASAAVARHSRPTGEAPMLQRVAESPSDDATIDRTAHHKLDPLLIPTDVRLQVWASGSSTPRDA
jgi:hypothetical protein